MPNLLTKISVWFKPKPIMPTIKPKPTKSEAIKSIDHQRYWQLINHLEKEMSQNERKRREAC